MLQVLSWCSTWWRQWFKGYWICLMLQVPSWYSTYDGNVLQVTGSVRCCRCLPGAPRDDGNVLKVTGSVWCCRCLPGALRDDGAVRRCPHVLHGASAWPMAQRRRSWCLAHRSHLERYVTSSPTSSLSPSSSFSTSAVSSSSFSSSSASSSMSIQIKYETNAECHWVIHPKLGSVLFVVSADLSAELQFTNK